MSHLLGILPSEYPEDKLHGVSNGDICRQHPEDASNSSVHDIPPFSALSRINSATQLSLSSSLRPTGRATTPHVSKEAKKGAKKDAKKDARLTNDAKGKKGHEKRFKKRHFDKKKFDDALCEGEVPTWATELFCRLGSDNCREGTNINAILASQAYTSWNTIAIAISKINSYPYIEACQQVL